MKRFVITGAPGSGKSSILRILQTQGYAVVNDAATDVISAEQSQGNEEPWSDPLFIEKITELQRSRQLQPAAGGTRVQIYARAVAERAAAIAAFLRTAAPPSTR